MKAEPLPDSLIGQFGVTEDATTKQLMSIWQELLGIDSVGPTRITLIWAETRHWPFTSSFKLIGYLMSSCPWRRFSRLPPSKSLPGFCVVRPDHRAGRRSCQSRQPARGLLFSVCMGLVETYLSIVTWHGVWALTNRFTACKPRAWTGVVHRWHESKTWRRYMQEKYEGAQPSGPYFLGGYCLGGTIAFEIARQIQAQGERVALLAMFDTTDWSKIPLPSIWDKSYYALQRLVFHAANFFRLDSEGMGQFFTEKMNVLRSRIPVWRGMLLASFAKSQRPGLAESVVLAKIWQANDHAALTYVPQPYRGSVTDFRPLKQYRLFNRPDAKWNCLAQGGQQIVVLPVYPAGMLLEPFVKHLAAALEKSIQNAIRECGTN